MKTQNKLLADVILLRVIVIFLLVVYHSFIIYAQGWQAPVGFHNIAGYWWTAKVSYSFMLETFVFISGYLLAYQAINGKLQEVFLHFTKKKASRLVLPCLIFSIIYFLIFSTYDKNAVLKAVYNGSVAHLWFLSMLFWRYLGGYYIVRRRFLLFLFVLLFATLTAFSFLPLPFQMDKTLY